MVRRCADRSGRTAVPLLVALGCGFVLAMAGCGGSSGTATAASSIPGSTYTLMQMNLCLSGLAGCYGKVQYPAGVEDAAARIREMHPDAVTFNEACGGDVAQIARQTGYHVRFSSIIYYGKPLSCVHPHGRGLFGDAVLTRAAIARAVSHPFPSQAGPEQRQWLCVTSPAGVKACTAHLASPEPVEEAANAPQCAELRAVLARRTSARAVIFGGDVNRTGSCAPAGYWTRTDAAAGQSPGLQQVYGSPALRAPRAVVVRFAHSDHDVLVVRARFAR